MIQDSAQFVRSTLHTPHLRGFFMQLTSSAGTARVKIIGEGLPEVEHSPVNPAEVFISPGQFYKIRVSSSASCSWIFTVKIDGILIPDTFVLRPGYSFDLETIPGTGKKFRAAERNSSAGIQGGLQEVDRQDLGLVTVLLKPELQFETEMDFITRSPKGEFTEKGIGTVMDGHSHQQFSVAKSFPIDKNPSTWIEINLRLKHRPERRQSGVQSIQSAIRNRPVSNPAPPPEF